MTCLDDEEEGLVITITYIDESSLYFIYCTLLYMYSLLLGKFGV
jgi:hypothetical protein